MDKQSQYLQTIHTVYPNFTIETAQLIKGGQFNDIFLINGETIFR